MAKTINFLKVVMQHTLLAGTEEQYTLRLPL